MGVNGTGTASRTRARCLPVRCHTDPLLNDTPPDTPGGLPAFVERIARAPADLFDLSATLVELLDYAALATGARSAYLKRIGGDAGRAIIACSEVGGVMALDGAVISHAVPVFDHGVQVASLVLLSDSPQRELPARKQQLLGTLADVVGLALRRAGMDEEIRRNQQALREAVEAKYQLLGGVSLNLKNALSVAAGYLQLLDLPTHSVEEQHTYVAKGRRAIEGAVSLINELVDLARAEAGEVGLELDTVNLGAFVRDAVANHNWTISYKKILVNTTVSPVVPAVYTDPSQLRDILDALMDNAVKYTPEGGVISVRAAVRQGRRLSDPASWVCVTVQDSGPGLADPDHIFEEVQRVALPNKQLGFRLVICRRVARLLGGDLTVESTAGRGTTFTLWLPLARRLEDRT